MLALQQFNVYAPQHLAQKKKDCILRDTQSNNYGNIQPIDGAAQRRLPDVILWLHILRTFEGLLRRKAPQILLLGSV